MADKQKERLFNLIKEKAFEEKEKPVTLSSGIETKFYFDLKQITCDPEGINNIAQLLYAQIKKIGGIKSVGGLEAGSISISTAISQLSYNIDKSNAIAAFYVRKKAKPHGLEKLIEGIIESPAVVVDDVVTTGKSALKAIKELRERDHKVDYLLAIVFRDTKEVKEKLEKENKIKILNLFYENDFIPIKKRERELIEI